VLAGLFGIGLAAGQLVDPDAPGGEADAHGSKAMSDDAHGMEGMEADQVRGLAAAEHGLRVVVENPELRRGVTERLRFRVVDAHGRAVRDFDVQHTKRMHVIVARRDLTGFQHLHPAIDAGGTWTVPVRIEDPGSYRVFADFSHGGEPTTLASDLRVDGAADLRALPDPEPAATSGGGSAVRLDAAGSHPGTEATLRFAVSKAGRPVELEPYLGAGGHLVALREGDLAFLHVHPTGHGHDRAELGSRVSFAATFPTAGRYRLFLQFKVDGRVQTVAFTYAVGQP
jgi:hypothetical protein